MPLPKAFLDEIRAVPILDVAAIYFSDQKFLPVSNAYQVRCNKHPDKTPSLTLYPDSNSFHCFSCQAGNSGADVISLVIWQEDCSFMDAIRRIAGIAKIPIPRESSPEEEQERQRLQLLSQRTRMMMDNLVTQSTALEYLYGRGLTKSLIEQWRLGWTDFDGPRLSIPIMDIRGQVRGFAYRALAGQEPKYKNSRTTDIYQKSQLLYGLHFVSKALTPAKPPVLVEGYFDVISLQAKGIHAVSPCGTAFTDDQAKQLAALCTDLILMPDGDTAGRRQLANWISVATTQQLLTYVYVLTNGDPDDLAKDLEVEQRIMTDRQLAGQYLLSRIVSIYQNEMTQLRLRALREARETLLFIQNQDERTLYESQVKHWLGWERGDLIDSQ